MPIKRDKKYPLLYIFINVLLKGARMDNNWAWQSVIKPVDAKWFQRIKYIKEGGEKKKMMTSICRF